MNDSPVWIFGAGELAKLAKFFFEKERAQAVAGFIVDDQYVAGVPNKLELTITWAEYLERVPIERGLIFPAIGYRSMLAREAVFERLLRSSHKICSLVCESAYVASNVALGSGVFVMPGAVIEPGVVLGNNNVFWSNSTVCHDTVIGSHNFIAANAVIGGRSRVGSRCFIGFSSVVGQDVDVCDDVLVGATAFLKSGAATPGVYLGSPACRRREIDPKAGISVSP